MNAQEIQEHTIQMRKGAVKMLHDGEYWTDDDRALLQREYENGTSINEIALILQRSESAIYQQIERMGLCIRNPFSARRKSVNLNAHTCLCKNCKCDRSLCPRCKIYQAILEDV